VTNVMLSSLGGVIAVPYSVIFQSAKLGDLSYILAELDQAEELLRQDIPVGRIYGLSGGALVALALGLSLAARRDAQHWGHAATALSDFAAYLRRARSCHIRALNLDPRYGIFGLHPLRRWLASRLRAYAGADQGTPGSPVHRADPLLSDLGVPLYLCALDHDGTLTLFGPLAEQLQCPYHHVRVGPPRDAPILDAAIAALSTMLSTVPTWVPGLASVAAETASQDASRSSEGGWFRDARPAIADAGAIVADLEAADRRPILRTRPYVPIRLWRQNWITSSFIMHSQHERNQTLLTSYYLDLLDRHHALEMAYTHLQDAAAFHTNQAETNSSAPILPYVGHVDLPYVGSTEAITNMRESVAHKDALMERFEGLLQGQLSGLPFDRPTNIIYGAGGFSGILAGLVTTRAVAAACQCAGGEIRQIYGVSAGVLNGFFHAVQVAAARRPDLYTSAARQALTDLESFVAHLAPNQVAAINTRPARLWEGWANLGPLQAFLRDRLAAYTGSLHPEQLTFDAIDLPMTVAVAREDGYTDFLGMSAPQTGSARCMRFDGREWSVRSAPVVRALIAGWSMNTYIMPAALGDQSYRDGGGSFYDPALLVACLDPTLTNLLNIHLDEPEGHSYHLPPRPNLLRIVFDTHNYTFPEERRRMRLMTDLLYAHYRLRARYAALLGQAPQDIAAAHPLPPDFRQSWDVDGIQALSFL
jgi:predicted acylesterase/phospholipase RssA